jgi:alpha-L-fucosidase
MATPYSVHNEGSLMLLPLLMTVALQQTSKPPVPLLPIPTARQLAWHDMEYYAFTHFGPNTFTDKEWGEGREDPKIFNPTALDCRQWARAFKAAGMKGIVITAKHHDGFCLWPSKYSTHTVAQSNWKSGKGDVLNELSEACKAEGLKMGVYLSPWDRNHPSYGTPEYNQVFANMLEEVLTQYGPIFEVWFDGANGEGPNGKRQVYDWNLFIDTVRKHQPNAVIFSDAGPDIRWVGNEDGHSGPTSWSTITKSMFTVGGPHRKELTTGDSEGVDWVPPECDVSIRPGWFYHASEDSKVKTLEHLMDIWHKSVGQNGSLLLNVPPDRRGLIHENDVARLLEFRKERDRLYAKDLALGKPARAIPVRGNGFEALMVTDGKAKTYWATPDHKRTGEVTIDLGGPKDIDRVLIEEHIPLGQRVRVFTVDAEDDKGAWTTVAGGTTIGRKRILIFPKTRARKVRLTIVAARDCPTIERVSVYGP